MAQGFVVRALFFAFLLSGFSAVANAQVVVIPLGGDAPPLHNVISVSKKYGDFTDPVAALESITDAGENNRYLVFIGPGVYTLTARLDMQEYVDIVGSGQNATKLTGSLDSETFDESAALIQGADHASLRNLAVENTGSSNTYSIGIYNGSVSPLLTDLTVTVLGGATFNYGVRNTSAAVPKMSDLTVTVSGAVSINRGVLNNSSSPTMSGLTVTASGGPNNYGVDNDTSSPMMSGLNVTASGGSFTVGIRNRSASSPTMSDLTVIVSGGTTSNYGVYNESSSSPTMSGLTVTASGGSFSIGVYNESSSSSKMSDLAVTASGGSNNYGVYNATTSAWAHIRNSRIEGATNSVFASTGSGVNETYISNSFLTGTVQGDPACSFTFSNTGTDLTADCTP